MSIRTKPPIPTNGHFKIHNIAIPPSPTTLPLPIEPDNPHASTPQVFATSQLHGFHILRNKQYLTVVYIKFDDVVHFDNGTVTELSNTVYDELIPVDIPITGERLLEMLSHIPQLDWR